MNGIQTLLRNVTLCSSILFWFLNTPVWGNELLLIQFPSGPLPQAQITLQRFGELECVDLQDFAVALNLRVWVSTEKRKLQFSLGSTSVKFTADNPFVLVGDHLQQLPAPIRYQNDRYWCPLQPFLDLFIPLYPGKILYDAQHRELKILPETEDVYAIEFAEKENGTLIRLSCRKKVEFTRPVLRDSILLLTLTNVRVRADIILATPPRGAVEKLELEQLGSATQLRIWLKEPILDYAAWQDETTQQINVSLITKIITADLRLPAEVETDSAFADVMEALEREQEKWKVDCVIIDPGHGGQDPGAIGVTGLKEKDVTLDVALRLKQLLDKNTTLKVLLTRDRDRFLGLSERTKLANQKGGKLFISIHCNSLKSGGASGFETYFLKPARNEKAMDVALRENAVIKYEESKTDYQDLTEENYILLAMAQSEFVKESETWAGIVQNKMRMQTGLKDRGVDQAGFYVLVGASMPAILVETAFLSQKREEKLLRTKKFRQQVAQALYESVREFMRLTNTDKPNITTSR